MLEEKTTYADQGGVFKVQFHQHYLYNWLKEKELPLTLEQLWQIREQCIAYLSSQQPDLSSGDAVGRI